VGVLDGYDIIRILITKIEQIMDQMTTIVKTYWKAIVPIVLAIIIITVLRGCQKDEVAVDDAVKKPSAVSSKTYLPYNQPANASPITGESCANYNKRTFGVVFNGDRGSRQFFSNVSQADFVAEIPHRVEHGQPRLLAVFGCNTPEIVGPMRSGRVDHINVAASLDAVYVPWGGSGVSKALLAKGVVDHIDCNGEVAPSGGVACFRRSGSMNQLEKASTSIPKLIDVAGANNYRSENNFEGFNHQGELPLAQRATYSRVSVKYEDPYRADYQYDPETNSYLRFFEGQPDIDFETKQQHAPKNLITIITKKDSWRADIDYVGQGLQDPWDGVPADKKRSESGQYPNMQLGDPWFDTKFEDEARFFFNGQEIRGTWKKAKSAEAPFEFYDEDGDPIHFVPGQIWLHILGHADKVSHETAEEYAERLEDEAEDRAAGTVVQ